MLQNMTRIFRANEEPENPTKHSATPVSKRVTIHMAGYRIALAVKLAPADLRALGWITKRKSLQIRGSVQHGLYIKQVAEGKGTHSLAAWPTNEGCSRFVFKAEGQTNNRVPIRSVAASIQDGVLHIKPLPDIFLANKPTREARVTPNRPKSPAAIETNKRTSLEDITAALALVNEARRELPYPTEAFVDDSGDVKLRVTL